MDVEQFYVQCNSVMAEDSKQLKNMNSFADTELELDLGESSVVDSLDLEDFQKLQEVPPGYKVSSAIIRNEEQPKFDISNHVLGYDGSGATALISDFCNFKLQFGMIDQDYPSVDELICCEHNKLYPYRKLNSAEQILYEYLLSHYSVDVDYECFEKLREEDLDFIKLFSFPLRKATIQDYTAIKKWYTNPKFDISIIRNYSLSPLCTDILCKLMCTKGVDESELSQVFCNPVELYGYARLALAGKLDFVKFRHASVTGTLHNYLSTELQDSDDIVDQLFRRSDFVECTGYYTKVDMDLLEKYIHYKHLPVILECIVSYGDNEEFFSRYLDENDACLDYVISDLRSNDFKDLYQNPANYGWSILKRMCKSIILEQDFLDKIHTDVISPYIKGEITYDDLVLFLVAKSEDNIFSKYLDTIHYMIPMNQVIYNFLVQFLRCKQQHLDNYPTVYQLKMQNSTYIFSIYEFIENNTLCMQMVNTYQTCSSMISYRALQGNCGCFSFGSMNATSKFVTSDRKNSVSIKSFLNDFHNEKMAQTVKFHLEDIKKYNILRIKTSVAASSNEAILAFCTDMLNDDSNKYLYFDSVLDFIYRNPMYLGVLNNKLAPVALSSLKNAIEMPTEQEMIIIFLRDLLIRIYGRKIVSIASIDSINLSTIIRIYHNKKQVMQISSIKDFLLQFDIIVRQMSNQIAKSVIIKGKQDILVTIL